MLVTFFGSPIMYYNCFWTRWVWKAAVGLEVALGLAMVATPIAQPPAPTLDSITLSPWTPIKRIALWDRTKSFSKWAGNWRGEKRFVKTTVRSCDAKRMTTFSLQNFIGIGLGKDHDGMRNTDIYICTRDGNRIDGGHYLLENSEGQPQIHR